jgi:hypothetical protein
MRTCLPDAVMKITSNAFKIFSGLSRRGFIFKAKLKICDQVPYLGIVAFVVKSYQVLFNRRLVSPLYSRTTGVS